MIERSKLLWFGRPPKEADVSEAKHRSLEIEAVLPGATPDYTFARGMIFWATPPHFEATAISLEASLDSAIDHGLHLHIVVSTEAQRRDIAAILDTALPGAQHHYRLRIGPVQPHEAPQAALMHNPGPPARADLSIAVEDDVALADDQRLLLQRAFHDCHSIVLTRISGGLSGAQTFLVDAKLRASNAGLRPSPFFVKLDAPEKLRAEMMRFREFAEHHIEWHLRPNFAIERSVDGMRQGVLVGAFVRSSQSLWEVVLDGDGPAHIRSLFQDTLGGLRQTEQPLSDVHGSVVEPLDKFCKRERIPKARVEAARVFGSTVHTPRSLWRKLLDLPELPWRCSATHGDMHGENVRTRKGVAIVIDFAHACAGPMSSDVASLEVWLTFKVAPGTKLTREEWRRRMDALYSPEAIEHSLTDPSVITGDEPIASCVQELRRIARDSVHTPDEYKRVLAVYLMREATFPTDSTCAAEVEFRRSYAYWLANQLVLALCATPEPQLETA